MTNGGQASEKNCIVFIEIYFQPSTPLPSASICLSTTVLNIISKEVKNELRVKFFLKNWHLKALYLYNFYDKIKQYKSKVQKTG